MKINFLVLCVFYPLLFLKASEIANYQDPLKNKHVVFFLSTPKSGSNLITGCLSAITRKPISWFFWGEEILNPESIYREHVSYNRLGLELCTDIPLLHRSHYDVNELMKVPSETNKLIFATRNPKELLYRNFLLTPNPQNDPDRQTIISFLSQYLNTFRVYNKWCPDTRLIVFYEDFINNENEELLKILQFIEEPPLFYDDFVIHKQEYLSQLLRSYRIQHAGNAGGASSKNGPQPLHYTKNASYESLKFIDAFLEKNAPKIWHAHLKRFES